MDAVAVTGLTKKYKDITAVNGITLNVHSGELFSLLGVNGAGKTTTIKMLSCLTPPTDGDALLCGKSIIREAGEVKSLIALSPQETAAAPNLSVKENLELMAGIHGFGKADAAQMAEELANRFGLTPNYGKRAGKLSGGTQRRLSIAMALISRPRILFLDEPTLGLDVLARQDLWDVIRELKGKVTVILTTHYMEEAEELSDRTAIMKSGNILMTGTVREIKERTGEDNFEKAFIKAVKEAV